MLFRCPEKVLTCVCGFSVYCDFYTAVVFVMNFYVQEVYGSVCFLFLCEFDVSSAVHVVQLIRELWCVSRFDLFQDVLCIFSRGWVCIVWVLWWV